MLKQEDKNTRKLSCVKKYGSLLRKDVHCKAKGKRKQKLCCTGPKSFASLH